LLSLWRLWPASVCSLLAAKRLQPPPKQRLPLTRWPRPKPHLLLMPWPLRLPTQWPLRLLTLPLQPPMPLPLAPLP
jgi:hypothetical protein